MDGDEGVRDIEYLRGLEAAVSSGVEYALALAALGSAKAAPFPLPVLMQARAAARHRIPLTFVLRRYLAAKTVLNDSVLKAGSEIPELSPPALHAALAPLNEKFDQLITAVSDEYEREKSARSSAGRSHRAELIQRLLRGEPADESSLNYAFDGYHLGLVVLTPEPQPLLRALSSEIDALFLVIKPSDSATWAWLGGKEPPDAKKVCQWADENWTASVPLGIGETACALSGWRQTHHQARAAATVGHLTSQAIRRYRDVPLISAATRDPLLLASMRDMYLTPLEGDRGRVLRATLRAFFDADRNSSSAAITLGVSRQTVSNRLQLVEERLNQPIAACGDLLRAALQLEECDVFPQLDNR